MPFSSSLSSSLPSSSSFFVSSPTLACALALWLGAGCSEAETPNTLVDAGASDGGAGDGGARDQGPDVGAVDAGGMDGGSASIDACLAGLSPGQGSGYVSVNRFRTADGSVEFAFAIQPDPDALGTSGSTPFEPVRFAAVVSGTAFCVTDVSQLTYTVTHHNFDDTLSVSLGDTDYTWSADVEDYGFVPTFALTVEPPFGPARLLPLTALGCHTSPLTRRCFGTESW